MPRILLDTNVLLHAASKPSPLHEPAARLLASGLRERGRFCISPQNLIEFSAVATRPRFADPPLSGAQVEKMIEVLWRSRRLAKIYPARGTARRAIQEGAALQLRGPVWYDLYLAVTMRESGVRDIITDNVRDFERIPFVTARRIEDAS